MPLKSSIVSVGAGNLATHLIRELHSSGHPVLSVFSRTVESARTLGLQVNAQFTNDLSQLPGDAKIYIISLSDDAIPQAISALTNKDAVILHTAGSVSIDVFKGKVKRYGVIYPLQTFSKTRKIDFSTIPFLLESSDEETMRFIREMISELSADIIEMNSEERKWIHLAAIFACNFTNHMFTCANEILDSKNIDFKLLHPLMNETINKAIEQRPSLVQTGPAVRGNKKIIAEHLSLLNHRPELQKLYTFVSRSIMDYYDKGS